MLAVVDTGLGAGRSGPRANFPVLQTWPVRSFAHDLFVPPAACSAAVNQHYAVYKVGRPPAAGGAPAGHVNIVVVRLCGAGVMTPQDLVPHTQAVRNTEDGALGADRDGRFFFHCVEAPWWNPKAPDDDGPGPQPLPPARVDIYKLAPCWGAGESPVKIASVALWGVREVCWHFRPNYPGAGDLYDCPLSQLLGIYRPDHITLSLSFALPTGVSGHYHYRDAAATLTYTIPTTKEGLTSFLRTRNLLEASPPHVLQVDLYPDPHGAIKWDFYIRGELPRVFPTRVALPSYDSDSDGNTCIAGAEMPRLRPQAGVHNTAGWPFQLYTHRGRLNTSFAPTGVLPHMHAMVPYLTREFEPPASLPLRRHVQLPRCAFTTVRGVGDGWVVCHAHGRTEDYVILRFD
ncbi:hypothetical protein BDZ91DRAFT_412115 [Kalaharituber pfeilii]|nr:hypothetical protein BDZ91DRAFT_412115 [Kalaharituber pfeilii]